MSIESFLESILDKQKLEDDQLEILRGRRDELEAILRAEFGAAATIKYGGSKAKGTMIQESYDLDIVCYLNSDTADTLEKIYDRAYGKLETAYLVEKKKSAIRVLRQKSSDDEIHYHVDVVPGRFVEGNKGDCFLHQTEGDKDRLKTNIKKHIAFVQESGQVDLIKLAKLWKTRRQLEFKTFVLEVFVIEKVVKEKPLKERFNDFLEKLVKEIETCQLFDPANGANVISTILSASEKASIKASATKCQDLIKSDEQEGWAEVFKEPIELSDDSLEKAGQLVLSDKSHEQIPPWPLLDVPSKVSISASVYLDPGNGSKIFMSALSSNSGALPKRLWIQFMAQTNLVPPYQVFWQVVNTGYDAQQEPGGLRGGFEKAGVTKWEYTKYKGKHYVLCHIVKGEKRTTSKPFFINISGKDYVQKKNRFRGV
jgi:hypothetical protein